MISSPTYAFLLVSLGLVYKHTQEHEAPWGQLCDSMASSTKPEVHDVSQNSTTAIGNMYIKFRINKLLQ